MNSICGHSPQRMVTSIKNASMAIPLPHPPPCRRHLRDRLKQVVHKRYFSVKPPSMSFEEDIPYDLARNRGDGDVATTIRCISRFGLARALCLEERVGSLVRNFRLDQQHLTDIR